MLADSFSSSERIRSISFNEMRVSTEHESVLGAWMEVRIKTDTKM